MRERSIILRDHEVQRILDGSKTMLRRPVKIPPRGAFPTLWEPTEIGGPDGGRTAAGETLPLQGAMWNTRTGECLACQVGMVGARLWVREPWASCGHGREFGARLRYRADGFERVIDPAPDRDDRFRNDHEFRWRPSIHMPRWASRLTLRVTDVRVERVQDISEADAVAEGLSTRTLSGQTYEIKNLDGSMTKGTMAWTSTSYAFSVAWNEVYPGSWQRNDWVWVVSFEVVR